MKVAWISGGVSSFIAAYLAQPERAIYIQVANQHPDTLRFLADCQRHLNCQLEIIGCNKFCQNVDNVIKQTRYINGVAGARCTLELKKRVRQEWERTNATETLTYVWGYDLNEKHRAERTKAASEFGAEFPLIERNFRKEQCHALLEQLGIKRPIMYALGYANNNCIGCVKGGKGYWNKIRQDFPDVFTKRAQLEREIGHSCINGCYLDELDPAAGNMNSEVMPACSFDCLGVLSTQGA